VREPRKGVCRSVFVIYNKKNSRFLTKFPEFSRFLPELQKSLSFPGFSGA